jgi:3-hydroxyisobutyrate dehydrogenase
MTVRAACVGIVGVGHMGTPMARNLIRAGFEVRAFDADPRRPLPDGVVRCSSITEVAAAARVLVLSLPNASAVAAVVAEIAASPGMMTAVADTSTIGRKAAAAAAEALASCGVEYADAPVSGGVAGAESRSIALLFAGSSAAYGLLAPVLSALSSRVFRIGDHPGMGQAVKVANNFLSATSLAAASEAVGMLVRAGVDPDVGIAAINASSGMSRATDDKFVNQVLTGRFASGFSNLLMAKDVKLYVDEALDLGAASEVGELIRDVWMAFATSMPDADFTHIYTHVNAGDTISTGR